MYNSQEIADIWPSARGSYEEFAAAFGNDRADRFGAAFWAMDPKADALFTSGRTVREIMPNLREALGRGEASKDTFTSSRDHRDAYRRTSTPSSLRAATHPRAG